VLAVMAIYAQETGQGMMLPEDGALLPDESPDPTPGPEAGGEPSKRSHLRVIK
jgi:stringent starvation protein B